jgi:hypothetical protein
MPAPTGDDRRRPGPFFTAIDGWFYGSLAAEVLTMALVPWLPIVLAALAFATPLRRSTWRLVVVVTAGVLLGLIASAPFIIGLLDLQVVDQDPVHTVGS